MRRLLGTAFLVVALTALPWLSETAHGCAAVWTDKDWPVAIASESAIIVWNAATKTQHFIRRASFSTQAKDFGFLVPTSTKPELAETEDEPFRYLAKLTEPKVITKKRPASGGCSLGCGVASRSPGEAPAPAGKVEVLEEKTVAGHDAAVLAADDPQALADWLKNNGYDYSPALTEWLKPYVQAGWIITAFKIARTGGDLGRIATKAVRMSFRTDQPFFPYREPQHQAQGKGTAAGKAKDTSGRLLRVFFLSAERMQGTLGKKGPPWPGKVAWANALDDSKRQRLAGLLALPGGGAPESWYLTEFEDASSPRPGIEDVYFSRSEDQTPVERPPHIRYVAAALPDGLCFYALAACLVLPRLVRGWKRLSARAAQRAP
jgi:hypothetical protein